jgi:hypothetical protein
MHMSAWVNYFFEKNVEQACICLLGSIFFLKRMMQELG